jgi:hypothetical protein
MKAIPESCALNFISTFLLRVLNFTLMTNARVGFKTKPVSLLTMHFVFEYVESEV